jgi:hypothetical protein
VVTPNNQLVWRDCHRLRLEVPDIVPRCEAIYRRHAPVTTLGIEGGGTQIGVYQAAKRPAWR